MYYYRYEENIFIFSKLYRNLQCNHFNIQAFEQELQPGMKMTEYIVIEGDWNAHHPAWLDHNIDDVGECILDFIVSNRLDIINTLPFDQALISYYVHRLFFN
ncbi:hypothetical protein RFI_07876 [Reticulomyxa filosa]|uniref:Endonuclease/exonuclease/phosphatase domain-containing protein n=1 Tax=Reticulomyxa filosa TaxID=46433 RepID=X6NTC0_RETFI|nr:hypothetical protein RFI_07876 [Reticulomyxa filosa]|eukprot:ETO29246.1 hypothetical protein RFI_07876 [Reticulomyxa filosa]